MPLSDRNPKTDLISSLDIFRSCGRRQLRVISSLCESLELPRGAILCRQGSHTPQCIVIVAGSASAAMDGETMGTVVPGSLLGHRSILYREPVPATVTTTTPTDVLAFSARDFLTLTVGNPALAPAVRELAVAADPLVHLVVGGLSLVHV